MEKLLKNIVKIGKSQHFNGEIDYGEEIESDDLLEAMKEVGTDEKTKEIIKRDFLDDAPTLFQTLLSMTFANYLKSTSSEDPSAHLKKSHRSLRLLLNLIQRSSEFGSKIPSECVEIIETLLATEEFQSEILLLLVKTADGSWLEFQKSPRYSNLVERVCHVESAPDDETLILAYFSTLFEKDYGFLANCYAELAPPTFCALLDVLKAIQERRELRIHSNNLLFVINLLELITFDFGAFLMAKAKKEPESVEKRRNSTGEMLNLLVEIVGEMCTNTEMTSQLNEKATAINAVIDVLDAILHSEAEFADFRKTQPWPEIPDKPELENLRKKIEEEQKYEKMREKQTDRPKQPPPSRIARVEASATLKQLSEVFLENYKKFDGNYHRNGELKLNCLKAIANLCSLSASNKLATVQNGRMGLLSVLQCTTRRPAFFMESYAMRNWCIFCVRQLTDECQENKEVILRLGEPQQPIIDRKRLLKEFGIEEEDLEQIGQV